MSPTDEIYPPFKEGKFYVPIFATCKVPEPYLRELFAHAKREEWNLIPIVSSSSSETTYEVVIQDLKEASDQCLIEHVYFPKHTLRDLYDFFVDTLRAAPDAAPNSTGFSDYTYAVIDEECLAREPAGIKICTDAPDEEDDLTGLIPPDEETRQGDEGWQPTWPAPRARPMMVGLEQSIEVMRNLETLVATPTEIAEDKEMRLSVVPPASFRPTVRMCRECKWAALATRQIQLQQALETRST